ncbi:protein SDA1 homolog [Chironomus tepperi]|uniref:protein SDA1 homolog n=1 Tax=Chironomus tepperi TaxID=113505 RepID=UPI00391EF0D7
MVRHNNQLPDNLPQLQNLVKRDPQSYKDDFLQQYNHFLNTLEIFKLSPDKENKSLDELVMFLAQVAQCYPEDLKLFPQQLVDLLRTHSTTLCKEMRNSFCRALILLRNKNLISPLDLLELFFQLLRCPDKELRKFLENHIITDIKNMNSKQKDMKLNATLQNFMYSMIKDSNPRAAKMSLDIMMELYKKNIWNDAKTVNVIATVGCFSKITKVLVASLKFFLGTDEDDENSGSETDDNEPDLKAAVMANRVSKKTKKRTKQLENVKKLYKKSQNKKKKAPNFNFSAIHLINNPQGMAEDLFKQLQDGNERFEVKLLHLDVISRLIGIHDLFIFSFYPYVTRFLQPHQRQVTRILQFAAQASHELIPPEIIEPINKTIANNFVTERNSSDVMAIGLNAIREVCQRCPLSMNEDLLRDLVMYKNYKDKSVIMAARSLITLYREQMPDLLHKKDRGRPTEASVEIKSKKYGEVKASDLIAGAEVLVKETKKANKNDESDDDDSEDGSESDDSDGSDNGSWVDVSHSENEAVGSDIDDDGSEEETNDADDKEAAKELALTKIFTDADFKKIEGELLKRKVTNSSRKRKAEPAQPQEKSEVVRLKDIEMIYKKRRTDKEARMESIKKGREGREKFGYKDGRQNIHCSKTNREKEKNKNFQMVRNKARGKIKKSFRDKQMALRKHLIQQKKMK